MLLVPELESSPSSFTQPSPLLLALVTTSNCLLCSWSVTYHPSPFSSYTPLFTLSLPVPFTCHLSILVFHLSHPHSLTSHPLSHSWSLTYCNSHLRFLTACLISHLTLTPTLSPYNSGSMAHIWLSGLFPFPFPIQMNHKTYTAMRGNKFFYLASGTFSDWWVRHFNA